MDGGAAKKNGEYEWMKPENVHKTTPTPTQSPSGIFDTCNVGHLSLSLSLSKKGGQDPACLYNVNTRHAQRIYCVAAVRGGGDKLGARQRCRARSTFRNVQLKGKITGSTVTALVILALPTGEPVNDVA